jgi:hypothetical protein
MQVYDDVSEAEAGKIFSNITHKRLSEKGNCGLGPVNREGEKSRAEPGGENHCLHRCRANWALEITLGEGARNNKSNDFVGS